ncbi:hypothetical protein [Bradyrhizobium cenepequi]
MVILRTITAVRNSVAAIVRAAHIADDLDTAQRQTIARWLHEAGREVEAEAQRRREHAVDSVG